jgi:hypothetical protein
MGIMDVQPCRALYSPAYIYGTTPSRSAADDRWTQNARAVELSQEDSASSRLAATLGRKQEDMSAERDGAPEYLRPISYTDTNFQ